MLPVYFDDAAYEAGIEALLRAITSPLGLTARETVIFALGENFNVWTAGIASDPQASAGFCTVPMPIPAK